MKKGEDVEFTGGSEATKTKSAPCPPGGTIGLLGGGQLGRMFAIEARKLGYGVQVFEPEPDCPASHIADRQFASSYDDAAAMAEFASSSDVITYEFENIPAGELALAAVRVPIRPNRRVLYICQNRRREKEFLSAHGIPCAPYRIVHSAAEVVSALNALGAPVVLKTADFGYDGKGQTKIANASQASEAWRQLNASVGIIEQWVAFNCELSVICARGLDGTTLTFPVAENIHTNHILDFSIVPARVSQAVQQQAAAITTEIAEALDVVGLITAEFFLRRDGALVVNELAPRPHNSGHYSFDACITSQFEQQVRAICGLPLGAVELLRPVVMVNLLGDLWMRGEPPWSALLADPLVKLHLYGKAKPRPGRKMGHFCVFGDSADAAFERAKTLKQILIKAEFEPSEHEG